MDEGERVAALLEHTIDVPVLAEAVERQEAPDAADTLESLEDDDAAQVLGRMEDRAAAAALAEMQTPLAAGVLADLVEEDPGYAAKLISLMAPDDAVDLLQTLEEEERRSLLSRVEQEPAGALVELSQYDEESAGGMMTTDFLALPEDMTVRQAIEFVRAASVTDAFTTAIVTDAEDRVVGLVPLHRLLLAPDRKRVRELMRENVRTVRYDVDREEVARQFDRYDYQMMAVVDEDETVLGVVTVDDVIDIIRMEQTEDVQKSVGAGPGEAVYSPLVTKIKSRFPWLLVNLFTSTVAAIVVLQFEDLIAELAILAVLMPVIANQAGNAGQQSLAVTLRGLVLDEVRSDRVGPLLAREAAVGAINGVIGGTLVGLGLMLLSALLPTATPQLGIVAGLAMTVSLSLGCFVGSSMPVLMRKFGFDPATGSTIFLTMTTDTISFLMFLGTARVLSGWLLG